MSAFNTYIPDIQSSSSLTVVLSHLILVLLIQGYLWPELIFQYQFHKGSSFPFSYSIISHPLLFFSTLIQKKT